MKFLFLGFGAGNTVLEHSGSPAGSGSGGGEEGEVVRSRGPVEGFASWNQGNMQKARVQLPEQLRTLEQFQELLWTHFLIC